MANRAAIMGIVSLGRRTTRKQPRSIPTSAQGENLCLFASQSGNAHHKAASNRPDRINVGHQRLSSDPVKNIVSPTTKLTTAE